MIDEEAAKLLDKYAYCPETGRIRRLSNGGLADNHIGNNGYRYVSAGKTARYQLAHRVAYLLMEGAWPERGMHIHHVNAIKTDNRWDNLRLAAPRENVRAIARREDTGITRTRHGKTWHVSWGTTVSDLATARALRDHVQAAIDGFLANVKGG